MQKILITLTALGVLCGFSIGVLAIQDPQVKKEISEFQAYFKKRFPTVPIEAYSDGVNALPQYAERRANWELLMEFPPFSPDMDSGRAMWNKPLKSGKTLAGCMTRPATKYPYYDAQRKEVRTIELDLNDCLKANGEEPIKNLKTGKIAILVAAFREQFNGQKWDIDIDTPGAVAAYEAGKKFYWTKRGQLNFSCANCHVHSAGKKIRGDVLSAGLGHTTGFPVYRTKWAVAGKPWGTVHRRYGGCNTQVRAKAFKPQSTEYRNLEFYEAALSTGVPIKSPSQRQ